MTEAPAGRSSGLSGHDLDSAPPLDVDAAETAPPPITLAMGLVRRKAMWVVGAAGLVGAGLVLIRQRSGQG